MDSVEDIGTLLPLPAVGAGEEAVVWGVVAGGTDVVQRHRPSVAETDLVCPGGHCREIARRVWADFIVGGEDGADGGQDLRVEVQLGDGSDDFVACYGFSQPEVARWGLGEGTHLLHPSLMPTGQRTRSAAWQARQSVGGTTWLSRGVRTPPLSPSSCCQCMRYVRGSPTASSWSNSTTVWHKVDEPSMMRENNC
jgi:hypothetical protein